MNEEKTLLESFDVFSEAANEPAMSRAAILGTVQGMVENMQETDAIIDDIRETVGSIEVTTDGIERRVASRGIEIATLVFAILSFSAAVVPEIIEVVRIFL